MGFDGVPKGEGMGTGFRATGLVDDPGALGEEVVPLLLTC